mgnify:CR=1 FL=1
MSHTDQDGYNMRTFAPLFLIALIAMFSATLAAQSTSGTLSTSDDSFTHPGGAMVGSAGGPRRYRAIEFNVVTTGNYTFTYTPTGYTGALYLYQNGFQPSSPIANIWTWGNTGSPVVVTHNLSVTGKFEVVLTSTTNNATGSWTLSITGPGTLQMGAVVNSCSPTSGSTGGGTNVTLSGSFFTGVNSVTFGGSSVTNLTVVNDTTITCTTPSHSAGAVTISASKPLGFGLTGERFNTFTYNLTPTSVSSINRQSPSGATTNQSSVVFRVTFAASAGNLSTGNFSTTTTGSVSGTSVTGVSGSGTTWDVTVNTGSGDGTIRLNMANDSGVNPSITNVPFTSGQTYTIDKTAPTVSSIVRSGTNPTNATSVNFTVTFNEAVTGVAMGNFAIDATGPSGASVTGVTGSGTSRTVSVNTGTGDGSLSIDLLTVTGIADTAGNALGSAFVAGEAYTIDKTGPSISIGSPSVSGTVSGPVDYIVTYTGASSISLASGNITLNTTGSAAATTITITGSGNTQRTVTISGISGTGTMGISIASGTAADALSNPAPAAGPSATFTVTAQATITSITRTGGAQTNAAVVSWNITFSSAVSGLSNSNLSITIGGLSGASLGTVSGSGTAWTATANTGSGNGTIRMDVNNDNGVTPGIANVPYTSGEVYTVDKTAPSVISIVRASAVNPTNASSVSFTVTFSESVVGVTSGAFTLDTTGVSSPSISSFSGSGASYTVSVNTGTGDGTVSIDLSTIGGIADPAGNGLAGAFTTGEAYTVDKTAPTVTGITRTSSTNPTNAGSVDFTVTFSETVTGVGLGAFVLDASGVSGAGISTISGSGNTRTVSVNTGTGNGSVSIDLTSIGSILDSANNGLAAAFTAGEAYTVDKTAPVVTNITRTSSTNPTNAASVDFTVAFSEPVTGVLVGAFALDTTGVSSPSISSVSGSGATYTVSVNTGSGDGSVSIDLTSVTGIIDAAGNTLGGNFTTGQTYTIDKTAPTVTGIARTSSTNPTNAGSVDFTVSFSETISGLTIGAFAIDATGVTGAGVSSVSGSGGTWTVSVGTGTGDGTLSIDLTAVSGIADAAGNTLGGTFTGGEAYTIDKTGPGVSIGTPSASSTITGPVDFTITYTGASAVTLATGDVTLNTTGTATGTIGVSGTGTATRTVTISSISGDGTIGISIAAGTATDGLANSAAAAGPSTTFNVVSLPTVAIGAPSVTSTMGGPVDFVLTYTNATSVNLTAGDITLNATGTAAGSVAVSGTGTATRTVTVSSLTGDGAFTISVTAGTSSNTAGNDIGAGPSASVTVDNTNPVLTPGSVVSIVQGYTVAGAAVGTASDTSTAAGSLVVTATNVPTGLSVTGITNTSGTISANIIAALTATVGTQQIEFTVTDDAGNSATANLDIDVIANNPPTITAIVDQSIAMNTDTGALAFTVGDVEDTAGTLVVAGASNNQVLVNDGTDFAFGGSGASRTVTVTPQTNNVGVAVITLTVMDSAGATTSTTFSLTVTDTVDAPTLSTIADIFMAPDTTTGAISFTADDPQGAGTLMAPVAVSDNPLLIANADVTFGGTAPALTFTIVPQAGMTGVAVITVSVSDGTYTASQSFTVTVAVPGSTSGGDDDDEKCSTGDSSGLSLLMLLGLLSALAVGVRALRRE